MLAKTCWKTNIFHFKTNATTTIIICIPWSDKTVCFTDCGGLIAPGNGSVDTTAGTTFGLTATFECDAGYDLIGAATRECQADGSWSNADPTCQPKGKCLLTLKINSVW